MMTESLLIDFPFFTCVVCTALLTMTQHRRPSPALRWLTVFFAVTGILYLGHDIYFRQEKNLLPMSDTLYATCNLLVYPLFYIYLCELTEAGPRPRWHAWLLALPIAIGMAIGAVYCTMTDSETAHFIDHYLYHTQPCSNFSGIERWQAWLHAAAKVLFTLEVVGVMWMGSRKIRHFNRRVAQFYANTEGRAVESMHWLLIAFVVTSVVSIMANFIGRIWFGQSPWLLAIPSILFSSLLLWLAYLGMNQEFTARRLEQEALTQPAETEVEEGINEDETKNNDLYERIKQLVVSEKLYLKHDLKIMDLTQLLHSNRQYVYNAINKHMGVSFADYINRLRIEHAERLIEEHPEMSMNEVAESSGYHSLSSFYRNRKKFGKH